MWNIVWVLPQGHRSVSVSRHFLLQAPQCPCSVRRSKPGCRIVGSHIRWELTTWADYQLCLHRLLMSTGCKSSHSGFLDVSLSNNGLRISGWIGQLSCLTIFFTSLSVAAFLRRAGSSMLERTGSHGRGIEQRVPEMRRMVEFNCTSTWLVWAERDQTWVQYSAAGHLSQSVTTENHKTVASSPVPYIFRKLFSKATFALQTVHIYIKPFKRYKALKLTIVQKSSKICAFSGAPPGLPPRAMDTFLESSFHNQHFSRNQYASILNHF